MKGIVEEWRFYRFQLKQNFRNQQALRASFMLQILGIIISNAAMFIIWVTFSHTIGSVNGWGPWQVFGMLSTSIFVFGLFDTFCNGLAGFHEYIPTGAFDVLLTKPRSLYLRILSHGSNVAALGDLLQGALGLAIFFINVKPDPALVLLFFLLLPPAWMIYVSFRLMASCVSFWMPQSGAITWAIVDLLVFPTTQPVSLLRGGMRFFFLSVIPALFIAGIPIEAVTYNKWSYLLLSYGVASIWFALSRLVLRLSLRRYESGNGIG